MDYMLDKDGRLVGSLKGPEARRGRPRIERIEKHEWWGDMVKLPKHALPEDVDRYLKHALPVDVDKDGLLCWVWPADRNESKQIRDRNGRPKLRKLRYHLWEMFKDEAIDGGRWILVDGEDCHPGCINPGHIRKMEKSDHLKMKHAAYRAERKNMKAPVGQHRLMRDGKPVLAMEWAALVYFWLIATGDVFRNWDFENDRFQWAEHCPVKTDEPEVVYLLKELLKESADPKEQADLGGSVYDKRELKMADAVLELFVDSRESGVKPTSAEIDAALEL